MLRLSAPLAELKEHYKVVVIGSGYGGAIAASRLARALSRTGDGQEVCVLERGRELHPGEYPSTSQEGLRAMQFDAPHRRLGPRTGLYDFRLNPDINVVLGCGLGGTSLINGNVALPPDPRVFDDRAWPPQLRGNAEALAPFIKLAEAMLTPVPYPSEATPPAKLEALHQAAEALSPRAVRPEPTRQLPTNTEEAQKDASFYRPPITVTFKSGPNSVGVHQNACVDCGDCCSGCNYGAKNTVLMNYLPDAHRHGARIFTKIGVRFIERVSPEDSSPGNESDLTYESALGYWLVHCELMNTEKRGWRGRTGGVSLRSQVSIRADIVILAAGTLGSTEILLRSQTKGLLLSDQLGKGFTGNGDFLGFGYNNESPINGIGLGKRRPDPTHPVGPTISGIIDLRDTDNLKDGFVIQDGAIPGPLAPFLPTAFAAASRLLREKNDELAVNEDSEGEDPQREEDIIQDRSGDGFGQSNERRTNTRKGTRSLTPNSRSAARREGQSLSRGPYRGAVHHTQTYLVMAHDDANGKMYLDPKTDRLRITWPGVGRQLIFQEIVARLQAATADAGGTFVGNPAWSERLGRHLATVHPLGGCRMGEDALGGVVNHKGQVFAGSKGQSPKGQSVHRGLYVCDGAIIPCSLGINPLLTISALAERLCALLAEDYNWTLDYSLPLATYSP